MNFHNKSEGLMILAGYERYLSRIEMLWNFGKNEKRQEDPLGKSHHRCFDLSRRPILRCPPVKGACDDINKTENYNLNDRYFDLRQTGFLILIRFILKRV